MGNALALAADPFSASVTALDHRVEEHPRIVVGDIASRPRTAGHVIVLANEKGGVGKSTLAFHICAALGDAGNRVIGFDLDHRQQTLARSFANREATARRMGVALPMPRCAVIRPISGAILCQEIGRMGWDCDFIVIDVAGHDSPIARRAIALADTLVTPINTSFVDLELLGRVDPARDRIEERGCFSRLVTDLREERARVGSRPLDWVVVPNRVRTTGSRNQQSFDSALERLAIEFRFRLGHGMPERVAYRELFQLGLTHLDLRHIPGAGRIRAAPLAELSHLIEDLALPEAPLFARRFGERRA